MYENVTHTCFFRRAYDNVYVVVLSVFVFCDHVRVVRVLSTIFLVLSRYDTKYFFCRDIRKKKSKRKSIHAPT